MAINVLYLLILLSIISYAIWNSVILGLVAFVLIIVTLIAEFRHGVKEQGFRKTIYEIITVFAVVILLFVAAGLILGTWSPVDVVASCSMLPSLHRGDMVFLHGISNMSYFLRQYHIPVVNVSPSAMNYTLANMGSESLAFFAYNPTNRSNIVEMTGSNTFSVGLYNTNCLDSYGYFGRQSSYYTCLVRNQTGLIRYNYSIGRVNISGTTLKIIQTSLITINNTTISENFSNPIIVYRTTRNDTFSGDIIHRVVAAINAGGRYYLLTRGDNNGGLDIQFGNYPVAQDAVVGYVIGIVPAVGYLKLIISGQLSQPAGCNSTILR
ncbi:MAG: S26 family signal peptidase [Candidatus Marsarchaeota archaeon]|nr:S26 family signal peptidase [Candidatus Marsarchaeota archaeon]